MKKGIRIALYSLGAAAVVLCSASAGFYEGLRVGILSANGLVATSKADIALSEVRSSMIGLETSDLKSAQHQFATQLQSALISLGDLLTFSKVMSCCCILTLGLTKKGFHQLG